MTYFDGFAVSRVESKVTLIPTAATELSLRISRIVDEFEVDRIETNNTQNISRIETDLTGEKLFD